MKISRLYAPALGAMISIFPHSSSADPGLALADASNVIKKDQDIHISDTQNYIDNVIVPSAIQQGDTSASIPPKPTMQDLLNSLGYSAGNAVSKKVIQDSVDDSSSE